MYADDDKEIYCHLTNIALLLQHLFLHLQSNSNLSV